MASLFAAARSRRQQQDPVEEQVDSELRAAQEAADDSARSRASWMKERVRAINQELDARRKAEGKVVRGPAGQVLRPESTAPKRVLTDDTTGEQFVQRSDGELEPAAKNAPIRREDGQLYRARAGMKKVPLGEDPAVRDRRLVEANLDAADESARIAQEALTRQQSERDLSAQEAGLEASLAEQRATVARRDALNPERGEKADQAALAAQERATGAKRDAISGKRETMAMQGNYGGFSGFVRRQREALKDIKVTDGDLPADYLDKFKPQVLGKTRTPDAWRERLGGGPKADGKQAATGAPDSAVLITPDNEAQIREEEELQRQTEEDNAYLAERDAIEATDDSGLQSKLADLDGQIKGGVDYLNQANASIESEVARFQGEVAALQEENQRLLTENPTITPERIQRGDAVEPWHPDAWAKLKELNVRGQQLTEEAESSKAELAAEQGRVKNLVALRDHAAGVANARVQKAKDDRAQALTKEADRLRQTPHLAPFADELLKIDRDAQARMERTKELFPEGGDGARKAIEEEARTSREFLIKDIESADKDHQKKTLAAYNQVRELLPGVNFNWYGKEDAEKTKAWKDYKDQGKALDEQVDTMIWRASQESGVPEGDIRKVFERARERDWTGSPASEKARLLSTGDIMVKPELALSAKSYQDAVASSGGTKEQKEKALANMKQERLKVAATVAPLLAADEESWAEAVEKFVGALPAGVIPAALTAMDFGFVNWQKEHPELAQGQLDEQVLRYFDTQNNGERFLRHMGESIKTALTGLSKSAAGAGAGATGSEWLHNLMSSASATENILGEYGARTRVNEDIPKALGFTPGEAYGTLLQSSPSIVGGALNPAVAAVLAGAQSGGGTYADAYQAYKGQGLNEDDARRAARLPAMLTGAATAFLTAAGGASGAEGLSRLLQNTATRRALHATLKQQVNTVLKDMGKGFLKGGVKEALLEEIPDQMIQGIVAKMSYQPGLSNAEYLESAAKAGVAGFLMGGAMEGAVEGFNSSKKNVVAEQPAASALSPDQWAEALDSINNFAPAGMSPADAEGSRLAAEAILYTGRGQINDLTTDQLEVLGVTRNSKGELENIKGQGVVPLVRIENGQPIITDRASAWLKQQMPGVAATITMDEATARQKLTQPPALSPALPTPALPTPAQTAAPTAQSASAAAAPAQRAPIPGQSGYKVGDVVTHDGRQRTVAAVTPPLPGTIGAVAFTDAPNVWVDESKIGAPASPAVAPTASASAPATPVGAPAVASASPQVAAQGTADPTVWRYTDRAGNTHTLPKEAASSPVEAATIFEAVVGGNVDPAAVKRPDVLPPAPTEQREALTSATVRQAFRALANEATQRNQSKATVGAIKLAGSYAEKWARRYSGVFKAVKVSTQLDAPAWYDNGTLYLHPEQLARVVKDNPTKAEAILRSIIREEVLHHVISRVATDAQLTKLWADLPPALRNLSRNAYNAKRITELKKTLGREPTEAEVEADMANVTDSDAIKAEEFLRQLLQKEFWNDVTEVVRNRPSLAQSIQKILTDLADALGRVMETITNSQTKQELAEYRNAAVQLAEQMGILAKGEVPRVATGKETKTSQSTQTTTEAAPAAVPKVETVVDAQAHQAATSPLNTRPQPTEAQKEAENYKVGPVTIGGVKISIENPQGSKRRAEWPALKDHYGRIPGTVAQDGELIDVFIVPGTAPDYSGPVFAVQQIDPETGENDEIKLVIGAKNALEAREVYQRNYEPGWAGFGGFEWKGDMAGLRQFLDEHTSDNRLSQENAAKAEAEPAPDHTAAAERAAVEQDKAKREKARALKEANANKQTAPVSQPTPKIETVGSATPNGARAEIVWDVVEAPEAAGMVEDRINENQNRQRSGDKASEKQRLAIATNPDTNLLGAFPTGMNGAPIVDDAEGKTVAGNGRMGGILQGYASPDSGFEATYKPFVQSEADRLGLGDKARGMKQPVLIRRATGYANGTKADFVSQNNPRGGGLLRETRTGEGLADAAALEAILPEITLTAGGKLTADALYAVSQRLAAANRPVNEDTSGRPDLDEATRRVQQAMLATLAKRAGRSIEEIVGVMESDTGKRVVNGIMKAAPDLARLEDDLSLTVPLMDALLSYKDGLAAVKSDAFANIGEWAANRAQELLGNDTSEESKILLDLFVRADKKPSLLKDWFDAYTMLAGDEHYERNEARQTDDIFGDQRREVPARDIAKRTETSVSPATDEGSEGNRPADQRRVAASPDPGDDAEYLAAVEVGDTAKAQALVDEAANNAGYTVGPVWHGTNADFDAFDTTKGQNRQQTWLLGSQFTTKPAEGNEAALKRSKEGGKPRVIKARLNPGKVLDVRDPHTPIFRLEDIPARWQPRFSRNVPRDTGTEYSFNEAANKLSPAELSQMIADMGYGSATRLHHETGTQHWIIFDPSRAKSAAPVTYDASGDVIPLSQRFDSSNASIRFASADPGDDFSLAPQTEADVQAERDRQAEQAREAARAAQQERARELVLRRLWQAENDLQQGRLFSGDANADLFSGPTAEQLLAQPPRDLFEWGERLVREDRQPDLFGNRDLTLTGGTDKTQAGQTKARKEPNQGELFAGAVKRGEITTTKGVQSYMDGQDMPPARQKEARKAIDAVLQPATSPEDARKKMVEEARKQEATAYRALIAGRSGPIRAALEARGSISAIMRQFVNQEIPSFQLRGLTIRSAEDMARYNLAVRSPYFESLKIAFLDGKGNVVHSQLLTVGSLNEAVAVPRDAARVASFAKTQGDVKSFIVAHNHPSGNPEPSGADKRMTGAWSEFGKLIGVPMLDHVVTNGRRYYSFRNSGMMSIGAAESPYDDTVEFGTIKGDPALADWEAIPMDELEYLNGVPAAESFVRTIKTADPDQVHLVYLNTKGNIVGVQRLDTTNSGSQMIGRSIARNAPDFGAHSVIVSLPATMDKGQAYNIMSTGERLLKSTGINLIDVTFGPQSESLHTERRASADPGEEANSDDVDYEALLAELEADLPSDAEIERLTGLAIDEHIGWRTVGNPEPAGLGEHDSEDTRRRLDVVRQVYDLDRERQSFKQWDEEADRLLRTDPMGVKLQLLEAANEGAPLGGPVMVRAASKLIPQLMAQAVVSRDPKLLREAKLLTWAYARGGTETARELAARQDRHKSPAERRAEFMTKLMFDVNPKAAQEIAKAIPPAEKRRRLRRISDELAKARKEGDEAKARALEAERKATEATKDQGQILDEATNLRLRKIEAALAKEGITLEDVFDGRAVVRLNFARIAAAALGGGSARKEKAVDMIIHGWPTTEIAKATGFTRDQVNNISKELSGNNQALRSVLEARVRAGFRLSDFMTPAATAAAQSASARNAPADPGGPVKQGAVAMTDAEVKAEVDKILKLMVPTQKQRDSGKWKPQLRGDAPQVRPETPKGKPAKVVNRGRPGQPIPDGPFVPDPNPATQQDVLIQGGQALTPEQQANINAQRQPAAVIPPGSGPGPQGRLNIPQTGPQPSNTPAGPAATRQPGLGIQTGPAAPTGNVNVGPAATRQPGLPIATQGQRQPAGVLPAGPNATKQGKLKLDPDTVEFTPRPRNDPAQDYRIARIISTVDATGLDMLQEYWINAILSGPQTHVVNVLGNAGNGIWEYTGQRAMEILLNTMMRDPGSAQIGEVPQLLSGLQRGLGQAFSMAARAWDAEADVASEDYLNEQVEFEGADWDKTKRIKASIGGKTGRVIRMPGRALMAMDSFFKTVFANMEVGAQAYRIGRAKGLTGADLKTFIEEEIAATGSASWVRAMEKAKELTFQSDINTREKGGSLADHAAAEFTRAVNQVRLLKFVFPFVRTPYNIFKTGLRKSPLGAAPLLYNLVKAGLFKMKDGKPVFDTYSKGQMVKHMSEQVIAMSTLAALSSMMEGDDDDDKKWLLITGGRGAGRLDSGERDLQKRLQGGSYQVRIGGKWIPYGRLEPFATALGTMTDAVRTWKQNRSKAEMPAAIISHLVGQAQEKTFLQGFSKLSDTLAALGSEDFYEKSGENLRDALLSAVVPNLIRQPLRNYDDTVRNFKAADVPYAAFPAAPFAEPAIDEYGREVKKGGDWWRSIYPAANVTDPHPADKMLENFARENPKDAYFPTRSNKATYSVETTNPDTGRKEKQEMPNEQKTALDRLRGELRDKMLKSAGLLTPQNVEHPTHATIDSLKKIREKANRLASTIIKRPDWRERLQEARDRRNSPP